jgi:uncharacterized membrane protein YbaN (DUF454 family)
VNPEEAKQILLPYRHDLDDANDPLTAEALALAKSDAELGRWLEEHFAKQSVLREKFRRIAVPEGLKEQITSEYAAANRISFFKKNVKVMALAALAVIIVAAYFGWQQRLPEDATLAEYQNQMASVMSQDYGMDLATNNVGSIRNFLKQNHAPSDFALTEPLKNMALTGCAVEKWQDKNVALVCFHVGSSSTSASTSDLWLFVVDRKLVRNAPDGADPQFTQIRKLALATWTAGDKLYLLGQPSDAGYLRKYL